MFNPNGLDIAALKMAISGYFPFVSALGPVTLNFELTARYWLFKNMILMAGRKSKSVEVSPNGDDAAALAALLEEAMKQPGVKEIMEVYGDWRQAGEVTSAYQLYQNTFPQDTVSSSSQPV